ncbi:hypothetical protein [Mangrovibacterium sp.]|uniref:hypothetical protein n=1 Tax=Mangrovibacterium sp. TaxID=1961364 RepID=UPI003563A9F4
MLGIVLINYKNEEEIVHYIENELVKISEPHITVIVDNSCNEQSIQKLESALALNEISRGINKDEKLFLIDAKGNLGYAKGNNLGAQFLYDNFECKYILFSNSDIQIKSPNLLKYLIEKLETESEIGAINPKITGMNGVAQTPMKDMPLINLHILRYIFYPVLRKITTIVPNADEGVYHRLMGCFLVVRSEAFFKAGMFDPNTFLFAEELILAEKMRSVNFNSYYAPEFEIIHFHSQTIGSFHSFKKQLKMMMDSELYYYKTYRNAPTYLIYFSRLALNFFLLFYLPVIQFFKRKVK